MERKRITEIDALRGIAAVIVVLYHYTHHYDVRFTHVKTDYNTTLFEWGHYGVQLFFIISGFVIFMSVSRGKSAGDFLIKRVFRLYPAYIAAILITFFVIGRSPIDIDRTFFEAIVNFSMFQEFFGVRNIDGAYWSLRVEGTFYLIMALVLFLGLKNRVMMVCSGLLLAGTLIQLTNLMNPNEYVSWIERFSTANYIQMFVIGIMFYAIWQHGAKLKYIMVMIYSILYDFIFEGVTNGLFTLLFVTIFTLVLANKMTWFNQKSLLFLGSISYPLYLIHQNIGYALIEQMEKIGWTHEVFVVIPLTLSMALAYMLVKFVEIPIQNYLYKAYKRKRFFPVRSGKMA